MKFILMSNILSPHQAPLANELVKVLGYDNFAYVANESFHKERKDLGWTISKNFRFLQKGEGAKSDDEIFNLLKTADVLLSGIVDIDLFQSRSEKGLKTLYMSERWFRPPRPFGRYIVSRFLFSYWRFARLLHKRKVTYLAIGVHAARDMARMIGLFGGDLRCMWRAPKVGMITRSPLSTIYLDVESDIPEKKLWSRDELRCGLDAMRLWGYFVEPSCSVAGRAEIEQEGFKIKQSSETITTNVPFRMLWCGRMLECKRVDTLVIAVVRLLDEGVSVRLKIVGHGPMEKKLRHLAGRWLIDNQPLGAEAEKKGPNVEVKAPRQNSMNGIVFCSSLPMPEVRKLMRKADAYVFPSDGGEGWGGVVNESMGDGCCVIATHEAGASETMIEDGTNGFVFTAGDQKGLYRSLKGVIENKDLCETCGENARATIRDVWSPENAAKLLFNEYLRCSE